MSLHEIDWDEAPQLALRPIGLVVDDNPDPLLTSLEQWMEAKWVPWFVPRFVLARGTALNGEVSRLADEADFVLLDNRFKKGQMGNYQEGLEVGQALVEEKPDLPIFFYTAYPEDWQHGRDRGQLRDDVQEFMDRPNVRSFRKGELAEEGRLREVCADILAVTGEKLRERAAGSQTLQKLLASRLIRDTSTIYRLEKLDKRRKIQVLVNVESPREEWVEIPTRLLINAGVLGEEEDIRFRVLEFSGGQVVSYFTPLSHGAGMAEEVRKFILGEE